MREMLLKIAVILHLVLTSKGTYNLQPSSEGSDLLIIFTERSQEVPRRS